MDNVSYRNYCDKSDREQENLFFALGGQGKAAACGVAYPETGSFCHTACEKALQIGIRSFLRRPSLHGHALGTITDFINEGIYILQEPGKTTSCSFALLYALRGKARIVVSENAEIYHFQDGRLQDISQECKVPLPGRKMRQEHKTAPLLDVSRGNHGFLLCCGMQGKQRDQRAQDKGFHARLKDFSFPAISDADAWAELVVSACHGEPCSALAVVLSGRP